MLSQEEVAPARSRAQLRGIAWIHLKAKFAFTPFARCNARSRGAGRKAASTIRCRSTALDDRRFSARPPRRSVRSNSIHTHRHKVSTNSKVARRVS